MSSASSTPPAATSDLSAKFDPATVEPAIWNIWESEKCFAADPNAPGDPYCIVIPPPNVTGALHLGHAINGTLQDILIRTHRMKGFNVLWVPGVDHAGIATQAVVEKQLKEKENLTRCDVGREALVERIWKWKQEYGDRIVSQFKRMGCSCDWDRLRFTLDDMCAKAVRECFFRLFKDGKVFRGKRLVNWDTHLQTSISDDELYTETVKTNLWSIKYPIDGTDKFMTVATTRPETMLADTAVAVHPDDPRWNWAIGKNVRLPLTNRLIPIIGDPILVDMTFGSGVVKVTPAHDPNDYAVWQRHNGAIAILNLMTPDGKINDADPSWSAYTGLRFKDARKKVLEDLTAAGLHNPETDTKPHEANVSFSDRSKTAIEPYLSDQWFVRMAELAEPALEVVRNGTVKFFPERHSQQYLAWLGEKRDWPISRQLWWGHRIPVWTIRLNHENDKANNSAVFAAQAQSKLTALAEQAGLADQIEVKLGDRSAGGFVDALYVCASTATAADWLKECAIYATVPDATVIPSEQSPELPFPPVLDPKKLKLWDDLRPFFLEVDEDPDVLDTWFSSGLWPFSTLGWPDQTPELAKWYPGAVLLTGRDIITLWVARMVMLGIYNVGPNGTQNQRWGGRPAPHSSNQNNSGGRDAPPTPIPFHHVAINPTILDGKGERMSKSKGNGVDPVDIIDTHGADALRFTLATMATETQDVRMPVKKDAQGRNTSDKFDLGRNFCTKLWNATKFALSQIATAPTPPHTTTTPELSLPDTWILSRLAHTLQDIEHALATYRFDAYAKAVYDFFWRDFCDWYLEAIKPALKDPTRAPTTAAVLAAVLDASLRLLHPITPYITEALWTKLNEIRQDRSLPTLLNLPPSERLVLAKWPSTPPTNPQAEATFTTLQETIGALRNLRNEHKVEPKRQITVVVPPAWPLLAQKELIELFAVCTLQTTPPSPQSAKLLIQNTELHIEGIIDPHAEANRLAKRREDLTKQIATLESRLASPAYTDKAPPHLVAQTRQQLTDAQTELTNLG